MAQSALRAHSSSVKGSKREIKLPKESAVETGKVQDFIKEEVLVNIVHVFWTLLLLYNLLFEIFSISY